MKILFKNHFQPMLECCELREDCLRKDRYEETLRGEHLPIEEEKRIQSHIDVLTDIRSEVDAVFLQDYKDLSLLFEDKKNGKVTPFRSFFISFQGTQSIFPYAENSRRGVSAAAVPVIQFSVTPRLRCRS